MQTKSNQILNVLERDGWCQGHSTNVAGQHCIRGAADIVGMPAVSLASACVVNGSDMLAFFNDRPETTFVHVRELLLAAASLELSNPE